MDIEPLKIPAFMRKKSLGKKKEETTDFFRASEEPPQSVSISRETTRPAPAFFQRPSVTITPAQAFSAPAFESPMIDEASSAPSISEPMPVGVATHFIEKINVVIVKLGADVKVGDRLMLSGEKGNFQQKIKSMQINRENVETAGRGDEVGIKVSKKTVVGEMVYVIR